MKYVKNYFKTICVLLGILILSLIPIHQAVNDPFINFKHIDKIVHFIMYCSLSFIFFFDLKSEKTWNRKSLFYMMLILIFSGIIECIQEFIIVERNGSFVDLTANFCGILFGFLIYGMYIRKQSNL
jgi:VanZ family protein